LAPPLPHISALLSSGKIPVVVYNGEALAVRSAEDSPYVAISHVWADGLGSTTEDGLPTCQIARIAAHAREFVPDGAFWVDALCVPAVRELRKRAIRLMADTYRRAETVVVFDSGIRALRTSPIAPFNEIFLRIATSGWMQRVWTLQEAFLAWDIYFELADGLLPITHLRDALRASTERVPSPLAYSFPRDFNLEHFAREPLTLMFERASRTLSFVDIVTLLEQRTTSKREDETIAIAGLLGIDVASLLAEADADARMRVFLLAVRTVPASIIVHAGGPRISLPGFRWAPRTLTSLVTATAGWQFGMAHCTPQGLTTE
ncbi:hypothetical protein C8Q80DRAFT_1076534, partial [Daedaleopsis nitida]